MATPMRGQNPLDVDEHHPDSNNPWTAPYSTRSGRQERNGYSSFISEKRRTPFPPREDGISLTSDGEGIDGRIYASRLPSKLVEARPSGQYVCGCCPKKPKRFDTAAALEKHEQEKQYECSYCQNRFKNKNEAERHENSLHLRHSWSCANLSYTTAIHVSSLDSIDTCGYCGEEFPGSGPEGAATTQDWVLRIEHLHEMHNHGECNVDKKFFRADHFRQHLKHSHASQSGKWTNMLENACMRDEPGPCIECVKMRERGHQNAREPKFCPRHQCEQTDTSMALCTKRKTAVNIRCSDHAKCTAYQCLNLRSVDSQGILNDYCSEHTCVVENCGNGKAHDPRQNVYDSGCTTHILEKCAVENCLSWKYGTSRYCESHGCSIVDCNKKAIDENRPFCPDHNFCRVEGCFNERKLGNQSKPFCYNHYNGSIGFPKNILEGIPIISKTNDRHFQPHDAVGKAMDDADNKSSYSKDSGYSSMVSKTQGSRYTDQKTSDADKWETESIASASSLLTVDTMSSINPTTAGGATEELADTLIKDDFIRNLIVEGYEHLDADRFERNLRRLLKSFALGLKKEAHTGLEKSAVRIVYTYRAYVIRLIRKRLALAEDDHATTMDELQKQKASQLALERFLRHLPGAEEGAFDCEAESESGNDSELSDGSDLDDEEQPYLPNLEKVKLYLLNSIAYSDLKRQLAEFVRPSDPATTVLRNEEPVMLEVEIGETIPDKVIGSESPPIFSNLSIKYPQFGSSSLEGVQFQGSKFLRTSMQIIEDARETRKEAEANLRSSRIQMRLTVLAIILLPLIFSSIISGLNSQELGSSHGLFMFPYRFKASLPSSLVILSLIGAFIISTQSSARETGARVLLICLEKSGTCQLWRKIRSVGENNPSGSPNKGLPETLTLGSIDKQDSLQDLGPLNDGQEKSQNLRKHDILFPHEPRHGRLENVVISMRWLFTSVGRSRRSSHLSIAIQNRWAKLSRKSVAKNKSRVEWKCSCGHDLYADFQTKSPRKLDEYSAILRSMASGSSQSNTGNSPAASISKPAAAHFQGPNMSNLRGRATSQFQNSPVTSVALQSLCSNNPSEPSFFELCVNTGAHLKTLGEIDLASISTDGALFEAIKKRYLRLRGFRSKFWLLKPAAVSFVRFSLENRHRVGILQKPLALPPKSEVDAKKWIYDPCPLEGDPPIAEDLFLHYLQCSEGSSTLFWMLRFPRKLDTSLLASAGASASFGWGIHIDEGPDFAALFKANLFILCLSGLAAGLWKLFERDFQGAFGFACWIIAVLNSLLLAYMFKWKQE